MELFGITQVALDAALRGANQRNTVIANNIANANVAGFKRSDVDFTSGLRRALSNGDLNTLSNLTPAVSVDSSSSMRVDGNNVDIDREATSLAQNSLTYNALIAITGKRLQAMSSLITQAR